MPHPTSPAFIVRSQDPLCGGPSLERLVSRAETAPEDLFVRDHGPIPEIDAATFRLVVDGRVARPLSLSLDDLGARFPRCEALVTLQCAGNRRDELTEVRPIPGEVPWGAEAIGTGRWSGFALADVLAAAGAEPVDAGHVAFEGLDRVERGGRTFGFGSSIALERAVAGDVLIADRLAGAAIPAAHGYPLRLVVPGFVGARSVKWLGRITVQDEPSANHFQARAYRVLPADADPHAVDWAAYPPIEEAPLHAVIATPASGSTVRSGPSLAVTGYATGRGLHPVTSVQIAVTVDGSEDEGPESAGDGLIPWRSAELLDAPAPGCWVRWRAEVVVPAGTWTLVARASDASGLTQPSHPRQRWNPKGYANDAWHRIRVTVPE